MPHIDSFVQNRASANSKNKLMIGGRMRHILGYGVLLLAIAGLLVMLIRDRPIVMEVIGEGEDGLIELRHLDSQGLTEIIQDKNGNGVTDFHEYRMTMINGIQIRVTILNSKEQSIPENVTLEFRDSRDGNQSLAVTMVNNASNGSFNLCQFSYLNDQMERERVYSDWDFDGQIDTRTRVPENQMAIRYHNAWLPVLPDAPYKWLEFVTCPIDGEHTRFEFRDGDFHPIQ